MNHNAARDFGVTNIDPARRRVQRAAIASLVFLLAGAAVSVGVVAMLPSVNREIDTGKSTVVSHREQLTPESEVEGPALDTPHIPFLDITEPSGLQFTHNSGARGDKLLPEAFGSGCAFMDCNNDGLTDILLVSGRPLDDPGEQETSAALRLFLNSESGKFTDGTEDAGLTVYLSGMGVAAGDFDNDGWTDLYVTAVGRNRLFHNDQGRFRDVTELSTTGGAADEWSTGCCWFDFDNDGDLDLFVCNYVKWSAGIDRRLDCRLTGSERTYCHPNEWPGTFARMFRNDGDGRFTDVSASAGVQVHNPDTSVPAGKSLAVVPTDINRDGWMDLVVSNDGVQTFVFINRGDSTFVEEAAKWGVAYDNSGRSRRATGLDSGYLGNDLTTALIFGGIAHEPTRLYQSNARNDFLTEDSLSTGLIPATLIPSTFSVLLLDLDLDGSLDILTTNGQTDPEIEKLRASQSYSQRPQLIWNSGRPGAHRFVSIDEQHLGDLAVPMVGRGTAWADIDADGDLDLLLTSNGGKARLLRNDISAGPSANNWIRMKLIGSRCNRDAIGARVELQTGDLRQLREVNPIHGYLSQSELPLTFGLGTSSNADEIRIHWPDGSQTEMRDVPGNRMITITQQ